VPTAAVTTRLGKKGQQLIEGLIPVPGNPGQCLPHGSWGHRGVNRGDRPHLDGEIVHTRDDGLRGVTLQGAHGFV